MVDSGESGKVEMCIPTPSPFLEATLMVHVVKEYHTIGVPSRLLGNLTMYFLYRTLE